MENQDKDLENKDDKIKIKSENKDGKIEIKVRK